MIAYCVYQVNETNKADARIKAEEAFTVLPPGTEDAWKAYVNRRMEVLFHRKGNSVEVTDFLQEITGGNKYVSVNKRYILCVDSEHENLRCGG